MEASPGPPRPDVGPPTLFQIARSTLITYKDCLSDIGYVPLDVLGDVLGACSPEGLAHIEDSTLEGSGRDLAPLTWPLWLHHLTLAFGSPRPGSPLPPLPEAEEEAVPPPKPGVVPAHYREVYEQRVLELQQRREVSGKRLRQLWEQEAYEKQAKQIQVIKPVAGRRGRTLPGSSLSRWASSSSGAAQPAGSRSRLLKKLGLSSRGGAGPGQRGASAVVVARPGAAKPIGRGTAQGIHSSGAALRSASEAGRSALPRPSAVVAHPASQLPLRPWYSPATSQQQQERQQQWHALPSPPHRRQLQPPPYTAVQVIAQAAGVQQSSPSAFPRLVSCQQQQPRSPAAHSLRTSQQQQQLKPQRGQQVQPPPRPRQQSQGLAASAAQADTWDLLDQPEWLPPARAKTQQAVRPQSAGPRALKRAAEPEAHKQQQQQQRSEGWVGDGGWGSGMGSLLDDPVFLPPPPKQHKQEPQHAQGLAGSPCGSPGGKQRTPQERGLGRGQGAKPQLSLPHPPGEGKAKKLVLPHPHARTVSAVKKAMQHG